MTTLSALAPAKVNLSLAITGRRPDGYHELESLVVFADAGDQISVAPAAELSLAIEGPFAPQLEAEDDNLVLRAARLFESGQGAEIVLTKNLPVAAGLGGGSSDAAAVLPLLAQLWDLPVPSARVPALGADLPVCLSRRPARVSGIGESVMPAELPDFSLVLANPGVPLPTGEVFAAFDGVFSTPPPAPGRFSDLTALVDHLRAAPNDLEPPARVLCPEIGEVLLALAECSGCRLSRMSGSGATCFGLFADRSAAVEAASEIRRHHPEWWVAATGLFQPR